MMNRLFSRSAAASSAATATSTSISNPRHQIQHNHHNHATSHMNTASASASASATSHLHTEHSPTVRKGTDATAETLPLSPLRPRTASTSGTPDDPPPTSISTSSSSATTPNRIYQHSTYHNNSTNNNNSQDHSHHTSSASSSAPAIAPADDPLASPPPALPPHTLRRRLNSRDIPRTYSGLYGQGDDDLLPFEVTRQSQLFPKTSVGILWGWYVTLILLVQLGSTLLLMNGNCYTWTCTNVIHTLVTIVYIHWLKGSLYDDSGEMDALTLWEQLEATPQTRAVRETLMVIPCILTWVACHFADYQQTASLINGVCWVVAMLAKLPFMNGVRLFGINRTAGIDDGVAVAEPNGGNTSATVESVSSSSSSSSPSSFEDTTTTNSTTADDHYRLKKKQ